MHYLPPFVYEKKILKGGFESNLQPRIIFVEPTYFQLYIANLQDDDPVQPSYSMKEKIASGAMEKIASGVMEKIPSSHDGYVVFAFVLVSITEGLSLAQHHV